jgi:hypothetical protein
MSINAVAIIGIMFLTICSFGFLADITLRNWKAVGNRKDTFMFGKLNRRTLHPESRPTLDCFRTCMTKFAWDVDETSSCALGCRS